MEEIVARHGRRIFMSTAVALYNEQYPERALGVFDACAAAQARGNELYIQITCQPLSFDFTLASAYPCRPVPRSASRRHHDAGRKGAVSNARRLRRVRSGHHPRAHQRGIARARLVGTKSGKPIGRAKIDATREARIRAALASGTGILKTACECRTGSSVVQRIKAEMARDSNADA
jgi:hypothetical protein